MNRYQEIHQIHKKHVFSSWISWISARSAIVLGQGVEPGCGEAAAQAGIDRRFRALMAQLAQVSHLTNGQLAISVHCM
jgi:hypothetical protein